MRQYKGSVAYATSKIKKYRRMMIQGQISESEYNRLILPYITILEKRAEEIN